MFRGQEDEVTRNSQMDPEDVSPLVGYSWFLPGAGRCRTMEVIPNPGSDSSGELESLPEAPFGLESWD